MDIERLQMDLSYMATLLMLLQKHGFILYIPPLVEKEIYKLEEDMKTKIPEAYKNFLKWSNGMNLFSGSLSLDGLRGLNYREGDQAIQPFNLVTLNTLERPKDSKDEYLFIGSYNWDGSKLYIDNSSSKVYRCDRYFSQEVKNEWSSFEEMFNSEVIRLSKLFDHEGRELNEDVPTTPKTSFN